MVNVFHIFLFQATQDPICAITATDKSLVVVWISVVYLE